MNDPSSSGQTGKNYRLGCVECSKNRARITELDGLIQTWIDARDAEPYSSKEYHAAVLGMRNR